MLSQATCTTAVDTLVGGAMCWKCCCLGAAVPSSDQNLLLADRASLAVPRMQRKLDKAEGPLQDNLPIVVWPGLLSRACENRAAACQLQAAP